MAHSPSHRSTKSISSNNLQPPGSTPMQKQQRRMTSPAPHSSLNLPEGPKQQPGRPPSPLRNGFIPDTFTGIDHDDSSEDEDDFREHGHWAEKSPSPSSSVSQLAANFAQRVGSFVGNMAPRSPGAMPTDAELEAEAERERDMSRREAERILTREAQERKLVEERVLAMMESTRGLPPPPSRSQTMPNPPSPSNSQKESSNWWAAAKNKLTPTKDKDPLTPAQQVIQEAKTREKDKKGKGKEKEKDWPATAQGKYSDPAFMNLNIPVAPPQRKPVPASPSSPTPSRPNLSNLPPNLTPSPMRATDAISSSPSREAPPLYAQFSPQGTLDVAGTLLTIAKRFEKLEKWTVGHVRALEERMSDVERWLVDKEKEKEETASLHEESRTSLSVTQDLEDFKGDLFELQGRVGELGREMAKLATAPIKLSSGPSRESAPVSVAPHTTSSIAVHGERALSPTPSVTTPHHSRLVSATARESTSPPMSSKSAAGTRLPYPTGDYYATPPDSSILLQGTFSPTHSPPSSMTSATRTRPLSIAGLPGIGLGISSQTTPSSSYSSTASNSHRAISPPASTRAMSPPSQGLPPPKFSAVRQSSVSPTPRKRYTVALGEPIVSPPELSDEPSQMRPQSSLGTAFISSSRDDDDEGSEFQDETIGKSSSARFANANNGDYKGTSSPSPSSNRRLRAQSAYGFSNIQVPQTPITPLQPRLRSRSIDRLGPGAGENATLTGAAGGKFVDPLVLRKQDKEGLKVAMPKPIGKVPIGQLVAFFDGDKKERA